jgi:hypothetical protein
VDTRIMCGAANFTVAVGWAFWELTSKHLATCRDTSDPHPSR